MTIQLLSVEAMTGVDAIVSTHTMSDVISDLEQRTKDHNTVEMASFCHLNTHVKISFKTFITEITTIYTSIHTYYRRIVYTVS